MHRFLKLDIVILLIFCVYFANTSNGQSQKIPKNLGKYEKPAQAKAAKNKVIDIPEPIKSLTYPNPVQQFTKYKNEWLDLSYRKTIEESNPKKDTSVYTPAIHMDAYKSSVDFAETYDFDITQYVAFTDWNKKYHFITIYLDTKSGHSGIEYLDSIMTRHYLVTDAKSNIMIHKATDRSGNVTIAVIPSPATQESNPSLAEVWPISASKQQKPPKEKPKFLGREFTESTIGTSFNHVSIKYAPLTQKYSKSLISGLSCLLPETIVYMAQSIKDPKTMLLEVNATYGDKPFYTSKWKTVKINNAKQSLSMAATNNK